MYIQTYDKNGKNTVEDVDHIEILFGIKAPADLIAIRARWLGAGSDVFFVEKDKIFQPVQKNKKR